MSLVVVCFLTGVAQPPTPQQPTLKIGIAVNMAPTIAIVQSLAKAACTIMAIPSDSLKNLIKFQLLNILCIMLSFGLFDVAKVVGVQQANGNKGYNCYKIVLDCN